MSIEDSYLRLAPGESGFLNIYLQFRYYSGGVLAGFNTGRILGYKIFNVSDEKPKFLVKRVFQPTEFDKDLIFGKNLKNDISVILDRQVIDYEKYMINHGSDDPVVSTDFNVKIFSS